MGNHPKNKLFIRKIHWKENDKANIEKFWSHLKTTDQTTLCARCKHRAHLVRTIFELHWWQTVVTWQFRSARRNGGELPAWRQLTESNVSEMLCRLLPHDRLGTSWCWLPQKASTLLLLLLQATCRRNKNVCEIYLLYACSLASLSKSNTLAAVTKSKGDFFQLKFAKFSAVTSVGKSWETK